MLLSSFLMVKSSEALIANVVLFGQDEWVHVRVGDAPVESIVWKVFGDDVQLVFYDYNNTNLSYDQFIIDANHTFSDPLDKFDVFWNGEITLENKIVLAFSSDQGQVTTVVSSFTGNVPPSEHPAMTHTKPLITKEDEIYDVVMDGSHVASFEWSFTNVSNQQIPQLTIYNPDGTKYNTQLLTATFIPIEYYNVVGWLVKKMGADYVQWLLYSGKAFQVRANQGFGALSLSFFIVYPTSLKVHPSETVTVQFVLPEGVDNYTASWNDPSFNKYIKLDGEPVFNSQTGQYEVNWKFLESAVGKRFTVKVSAVKYGTTYQATASILVQAQTLNPVIMPLIGGVSFLAFFVIFLIFLIRRRKIHPRSGLRNPIELM